MLRIAQAAVLAVFDTVVKDLDQDDYAEFLDWLASEAKCREMALKKEMGDD